MEAVLSDGDGFLVVLLLVVGVRATLGLSLTLAFFPRPLPLTRFVALSFGLLELGPSSSMGTMSLFNKNNLRCSDILTPHSFSSGESTFSSAASSGARGSRLGMEPGCLREVSSSNGFREGAS